MKRRSFCRSLASATVILGSSASRAQLAALPMIGYINGASAADSEDLADAFRDGLRDGGYIEGRNVAIEYRWADGHYGRLRALVDDAVHRRASVIAATSTPVALAAQAATTSVPVAFTVGADPVKIGLVASLSRPGANLTGVTRVNVELGPKRLELLHECVPEAPKFAVLLNPDNPNNPVLKQSLQMAAGTLGLLLQVFEASTDNELAGVFETLGSWPQPAMVIGNDPLFNSISQQLAELTVRHAVPTIYQYRKFVASGGLISYGASNTDSHRRLGVYVARILAGASPATTPVEQSTKIDLMINLRTGRTLRLALPQRVLARADEVIDEAP